MNSNMTETYTKDLSIVISLFNEEESLPELISWIEKVMKTEGYRYEVIMVDDGSTDTCGTIADDYAHHPQELAATIQSVKTLYPDRYVIAVFQPHLYSRTRDFADDFARVLSEMDEVVLLPIYPAREEPIVGVTSEWLMGRLGDEVKKVLAEPNVVGKYLRLRLKQCLAKGQNVVVLTMGAGDIDQQVEDIKRNLTYKIL